MKNFFAILLAFSLLANPLFATSVTLTGAGVGTVVLPPTGMKTPVISDPQASVPSNTANNHMSVSGGTWTSASSNRDQPWPKSGSFKNLTVSFPTVLTQGTYTITLVLSGTLSLMTCQITTSTQTCTDTTHEIIISPGATLSWRSTPSGTPTTQSGQIKIAALFTSYTSDGVIATPHISSPSNTVANYMTVGDYAATSSAWQAVETQASGIIPTPGTLDSIYVISGIAPGAATSFTFTIYLNGVIQGTSACAISGSSATSCSVTGLSIAVVAGDLVSTEAAPSGSPSSAFTPRISVGWVPTTVGEAVQITATGALSGATNRYDSYNGPSGANGTEATVLVIAPSVFTIKLLRVTTAPSAIGTTRQHVLRQGTGGGQSSQAVTCTLNTGNPTSCTDSVNTFTTTLNDLLNWGSLTSTSPVTTSYKFSSVMYTP